MNVPYKGFDKDLKCRGFKYEIGGEYEAEGEIRLCRNGFHACEVPLDVMTYYPPGGSRYCEVEQSGTMRKGSDDSKVASEKIKIGAEIGLTGLIKAQIAYVEETCKGAPEKIAQGNWGHAATQGYGGHAAAQGDMGHAAAQGYGGHAAAQGYGGHAEVGGKDAIAAAFGIEGKARAALGSWIMCAEWVYTDFWHIKDVRAARIDGEKLKPDTWYMLKDGEFVEAEDNE
nr:MAG TPA: hypothetical protein [Caudoviricetes sp.]